MSRTIRNASVLAATCALCACASPIGTNTGGYPFYHPQHVEAAQAFASDHVVAVDRRLPEVQGSYQASDAYLITVLTESGTNVVIKQASANGLRVGDRVQIVDGAARPY